MTKENIDINHNIKEKELAYLGKPVKSGELNILQVTSWSHWRLLPLYTPIMLSIGRRKQKTHVIYLSTLHGTMCSSYYTHLCENRINQRAAYEKRKPITL